MTDLETIEVPNKGPHVVPLEPSVPPWFMRGVFVVLGGALTLLLAVLTWQFNRSITSLDGVKDEVSKLNISVGQVAEWKSGVNETLRALTGVTNQVGSLQARVDGYEVRLERIEAQ